MNALVKVGVAVISTVALGVGVATPALAAPGGFMKSDFAGYDATAGTAFTSFAGTLTVPTVNCAAAPDSQLDPVVSVFDPSTGDGANASFFVECSGGTVDYLNSSVDVGGGGTHNSSAATDISPGDILRFSGRENAKGTTYTMTITDATTGYSASASAPMSPSFTGISAATFANCFSGCTGTGGAEAPIPSFTQIAYGHLTFGGASLAALSPTGYEMYNGSHLQVATSRISVAGTFTTRWVASS
jgi:hypothetical protein